MGGGTPDGSFEGIDEDFGDVEADALEDLSEACGAGYVDFSKVVADRVHADQQQAAARAPGAAARADPRVAIGRRRRGAEAAGSQVAAYFAALRDARERIRDRLAADHEDALV